MRTCPKCGTTIDNAAAVRCPLCNASLPAVVAPAPTRSESAASPQPRTGAPTARSAEKPPNSTWLILVLALGAVAVVGLGIVGKVILDWIQSGSGGSGDSTGGAASAAACITACKQSLGCGDPEANCQRTCGQSATFSACMSNKPLGCEGIARCYLTAQYGPDVAHGTVGCGETLTCLARCRDDVACDGRCVKAARAAYPLASAIGCVQETKSFDTCALLSPTYQACMADR